MNYDQDELYALLPREIRRQDLEAAPSTGVGRLQALVAVLSELSVLLTGSIDALYDDAFIETCQDWLVPYIGDLVGYRPLRGDVPSVATPRGDVANTIALRRSKGTVQMLQQAVIDVTGWPALVTEGFRSVDRSEYIRLVRSDGMTYGSVRPPALASLSVSDPAPLSLIGTPFESTSRRIDLRRPTRAGQFNLSSVVAWAWRQPAIGREAMAWRAGPGQYFVHPLGIDATVVGRPRDDPAASSQKPAHIDEAPQPLTRVALMQALARASSTALPAGLRISLIYEDSATNTVTATPLGPSNICMADSGPAPAGAALAWRPPDPGYTAALDPQTGRLTIAGGSQAGLIDVQVTSYVSAPAIVGGGYPPVEPVPPPDWAAVNPIKVRVDPGGSAPAAPPSAPDLPTALADAAYAPVNGRPTCVIDIDVVAFLDTDPQIEVPDHSTLVIEATTGKQFVFRSRVTATLGIGSNLVVHGALFGGGLSVVTTPAADDTGANPSTVELADCTVAPWRDMDAGGNPSPPATAGIEWATPPINSRLQISRSVVGTVSVPQSAALAITDSVVDALSDAGVAIAAAAGQLDLVGCTVIGAVNVLEVGTISNSIVTGIMTSTRVSDGCVRFSYLTPGSRLPSPYRCQPIDAVDTDLAAARAAAGAPLSQAQSDAVTAATQRALRPIFRSRVWTRFGYAVLADSNDQRLLTGADDGCEPGVGHQMYGEHRWTNALTRLSESAPLSVTLSLLAAT